MISRRASPPSPRAVVAAFVAVSALGQASSARADDDRETARLTYVVGAGTSGCPDEESFRNLVTARLGYDPFESNGKHAAVVEITREAGRLHARARVTRQGQPEPGVRELDGGPGQCDALTTALATAVAIALDPVRGMAGPAAAPLTTPTPAPTPAPTPPVPAAVPAKEASPAAPIAASTPPVLPAEALTPSVDSTAPSPRMTPFYTAGALVSAGAAPGATVGGELGIGARIRPFTIEMLFRAEGTPGPPMLPSGDRVEVVSITATLLPCGNVGGWFGCALLRAGAVQGRAVDLLAPTRNSSPFVAAGLRAGYTLRIAGPVSARAAIEAAFPLTRTVLTIDAHPVWTAPLIAGGLDLGVVLAFR